MPALNIRRCTVLSSSLPRERRPCCFSCLIDSGLAGWMVQVWAVMVTTCPLDFVSSLWAGVVPGCLAAAVSVSEQLVGGSSFYLLSAMSVIRIIFPWAAHICGLKPVLSLEVVCGSCCFPQPSARSPLADARAASRLHGLVGRLQHQYLWRVAQPSINTCVLYWCTNKSHCTVSLVFLVGLPSSLSDPWVSMKGEKATQNQTSPLAVPAAEHSALEKQLCYYP